MADILNLSSRQSKLQKEQQKRREAAKLRIQKEKRTREAAARDQARIDEQIRQRKLDQRRKEEEVGCLQARCMLVSCQSKLANLYRFKS